MNSIFYALSIAASLCAFDALRSKSQENISTGYGCLLQCMGECLAKGTQVEQIRDCKISCKSHIGNQGCLENEDLCDDVCKSEGTNSLRKDDSLEQLQLSAHPSSTFKGPRIVEITWKNLKNVSAYVARFREANGSWMYQESNANSFVFVRPKTCVPYRFQVAYLIRDAHMGIKISPFSPVFTLDATPAWTRKIFSTPTGLYVNKSRPFLDETTNEKMDNSSIIMRHRVILPPGWVADDFKFVGKYWRIYRCETEPKGGMLLVTFSKIVEDNKFNYIESIFPMFYGINKCTVVNQLKSVTVCDKAFPIPFDFVGNTYKIKLDCRTVENLPCSGEFAK